MKSIENIKKIAVVGAGTMGSGIAQVAAQAGFATVLYDVIDDATAKGFEAIKKNLAIAVEKKKITAAQKEKALSLIKVSNDISDLIADVVIEAIVEKLEVKAEMFNKLAEQNDHDSIFCTNTSSIPITKIAESISHPERLVGMHFFNPAHLM